MLKKILNHILWWIFKLYPKKIVVLIKENYNRYKIQNCIPKADLSSYIGENCYIVGGNYITIGKNSRIHKNTVLTAWDSYEDQHFNPKIQIGNNVIVGEYGHITAINEIVISDGVLTGHHVTITDNSHGNSTLTELQIAPIKRPLYSKGSVIIDKNVWIGDKVTILPNVHIGEGSIIAANAVVTKDIPPYSIAAGNPAKIINRLI